MDELQERREIKQMIDNSIDKMKREKEGTLLSMWEDVEHMGLRLNVIHNNLLVSSQTIIFVKKGEEVNENGINLIQLTDGNTHHCFIHKELLQWYKLVRIIDGFLYVFEYRI